MFAWELANEPQTRAYYEHNASLPVWEGQMDAVGICMPMATCHNSIMVSRTETVWRCWCLQCSSASGAGCSSVLDAHSSCQPPCECTQSGVFLYAKACNHRLQAGALVTAWLREMSAYVKQLDPAHMVSSGGVGYRLSAPSVHQAAGAAAADARLESMERRTLVADAAAEQAFTAAACCAEGAAGLGAQINWPFKGEDYVANVLIDTLDFATIHSYAGAYLSFVLWLSCGRMLWGTSARACCLYTQRMFICTDEDTSYTLLWSHT